MVNNPQLCWSDIACSNLFEGHHVLRCMMSWTAKIHGENLDHDDDLLRD